jgi:hypothetical protein
MALGATYQLPVDDRTNYPEDYLRARIISTLGGRAAEQLIYGVVTTGGENDLQQVTEIARQMVLRWGMSEKLGPISFVAPQDDGLPPAFQRQPYSEATAELIDAEVRRIVEECQREATRLLARTATSWSRSPRRCSRPRRSTSARFWKSPDSARPERAPPRREDEGWVVPFRSRPSWPLLISAYGESNLVLDLRRTTYERVRTTVRSLVR